MTFPCPKRRIASLWMVALLLLAGVAPLSAQDSTPQPGPVIVVTSQPFEMAFGPGPFDLPDPAAGLAELDSYNATLTITFSGTQNGQAAQDSVVYTLLHTTTPPARQLLIETAGAASTQESRTLINGTIFEQRPGEACEVSRVANAEALALGWEPASILDSVFGAEEAGSDAINGLTANHYTFDERAQAAAGLADSTGDLWVMPESGTLVGYTLDTTAGPAYFGEGVEGTLSFDYRLTSVNQPITITTPEGCAMGQLALFAMPDAADVVRMAGAMSFTTASSPADVAAYYEEQIAALGGQIVNPPVIAGEMALAGFTLQDQPLLLFVAVESGTTQVHLMALDDPAGLSIAAEVPPIAPPVIIPAETLGDCTTGGIPMLPDASDLTTLSGALAYIAPFSVGEAATFYEEQFNALGAEVSAGPPLAGMAVMEITQGIQVINLSLLAEGDSTRVTFSTTTGSPLTPASACGEAGSDTGQCVAGIPILPNAANVQAVGPMVTYDTDMPIPEIAAFYEEQIAALGGQVSSTMPASDMMAMLQAQVGDQALMLMISPTGRGNNVAITSMMGTPLPSLEACPDTTP